MVQQKILRKLSFFSSELILPSISVIIQYIWSFFFEHATLVRKLEEKLYLSGGDQRICNKIANNSIKIT